MLEVLNSTGIQTLVTALVGTIALVVYYFQKRDKKRSAATMLLLEIQQAERAIVKVKENLRQSNINMDMHILQSDTWEKNKYLFTKDFDKDEWDAITDYYNKARLLDESIRNVKKGFDDDVQQIRVNKQRTFADIIRDALIALAADDGANSEQIIKSMQNKISVFDKIYMDQQNKARYNPQKTVDDATHCVEDLAPISTTSVGQKLKKISHHKTK